MRDSLDLFTDARRQLNHADTRGRDMVISCGAILNHVEVAAAAAGWATNISRLPDPQDPTLLARITFDESSPTQVQVLLANAIDNRSTDRRQVSSWTVPKKRVEKLGRLAASYGVFAEVDLDERQSHIIGESLREASCLQAGDDACVEELLEWTNGRGFVGIPSASLLTDRAANKEAASVNRFPVGLLDDEYDEDAPPRPLWILLSTSSDDVLSWLRTGEALSAMWLYCSSTGLSLVPYSQPVEVAETRSRIERGVLSDTSCPQVLVRIGWLTSPQEAPPRTQRLPVEALLSIHD